ncbi:uncharacterized protein LOC110253689 [Exaiptasia diaphana]|uniref:Uncharacterized protein n=1 Tax=Exaiptasia diaphana TaxID=2652724 RepID=A0A913Y835_EXADI|nr:uncharacterized protein LOC110253689 [Exaiptasia diaphana]KXJ21795.1 Uncharacterized protein C8orf76 [Exaiptasia diaphana]
MELGLSWDDELFESKEEKPKRPKQKPYNVKVCEKQYFFKNHTPQDDIQKQNITKFQADYWYRSGSYTKSLEAYLTIHKNPQVKSTTVERDVDESIIRCYLKLGNVSLALVSLDNLIKKQGEDTSLFLLLAEICSAISHIQGEITCYKRCISLHSYNHNFWYSLAKAYNKAHVVTTNNKVNNSHVDEMHTIDAILQSNTTKSYKECLRLLINCQHCKCTDTMNFLDKTFLKDDDNDMIVTQEISNQVSKGSVGNENNLFPKQKVEYMPEELMGKMTLQEMSTCLEGFSFAAESSKGALNKLLSEKLQVEKDKNGFNHPIYDKMLTKPSIDRHKEALHSSQSVLSSQTRVSSKLASEVNNLKEELSSDTTVDTISNTTANCKSLSSKYSDSDGKTRTQDNNEVPYLVVGEEDGDGCSFNMTITKDSNHGFHDVYGASKDGKQCGLSMLAFFCLLRTRFLLQRAIWTSMSFVKEKLSKTMKDVDDNIRKCSLCQCGELKKCILKQMELEDKSLAGQQLDELDMHSLYQGGRQKHWT